MKILIADKFEKSGMEGLRATGAEVFSEPDLKGDTLGARLAALAADVLVVRSTKVTRPILEGSPELALVVRAGAGVNTIDLAAASERGIFVANCPGKNSIAVAELAMGLILSLDRRIPDNTADLRAGKWNKQEYSRAAGLFGRTLGIIGMGSIGREVAVRARAFGMPVLAWSRSLSGPQADALGVRRAGDLLEVAREADVVSVHLALTEDTRRLLGREFFEAMKPGAFFVNTARAEIADSEALLAAIAERGLRVGLDVFPGEPAEKQGKVDDPLARNPSVVGTHHIGASTDQAQEAIAAETVRIVRIYAETGRVANAVNLTDRPPATHLLVVRHRDRVGVLAHVLGALRTAGISVQRMENIVFEGAAAACARIELDHGADAALLEQIRAGNADIFSLSLSKIAR
jgi:D-3-phosphoglycerate dehydrogenase